MLYPLLAVARAPACLRPTPQRRARGARRARRVHRVPVHIRHSSSVSRNTRCCELRHARGGRARAVSPSVHRGRDLWSWQLHLPLRSRRDPHRRPATGGSGRAERTRSSPPGVATGGPASRHLCGFGRAHVIRRSTRGERIRRTAIDTIRSRSVRVPTAACAPNGSARSPSATLTRRRSMPALRRPSHRLRTTPSWSCGSRARYLRCSPLRLCGRSPVHAR
jgi:hypothetical protein